ncbi:hypothetical protein ZIOFF_021165 [Zingiber officinale]|uniref:Bulb-type lectin domain-containing protein n=1 Tax=Zingiber officinale TaxID=94328 RepID=A0A8J5HB17_ZINOF|nr:hypothetical protein ZIOFF_021165 [Zingiber officinale]
MPTFTVTSTDTISTQHSLTGNQTITSGGGTGTFVLGFFTTPGSCGNYYIGICSKPIWSTNVTTISSSNSTVVAVILDNGNFQLRNETNSSVVLWQSFDQPTDTWLPGIKLGFNKLTSTPQRLTSWKNKIDPSPRLFTLQSDPTGATSQYFLLWNSSKEYWTGGIWDGDIFTSVPEMRWRGVFNFAFINNTEETYLPRLLMIPTQD